MSGAGRVWYSCLGNRAQAGRLHRKRQDTGSRESVCLGQCNLILGILLAAACLFFFRDTFIGLAQCWSTDPNYSHGFLVPLVSLYLAWQKCSQARVQQACVAPRGGALLGGTLIALGMTLHYTTLLIPSLVIPSVSLLVVLAGMLLLLGGWTWWSRLWPALAFLVFMIPWPTALYSRVAFPLQLLVSGTAADLLQTLGIPVLREGNLLHLPVGTMHVAQACSGLRQLTAFLAIGACAALIMRRPGWYRVTLLGSAVPIAVLVNILRVTGTGVIQEQLGPEAIEGALHTAEGMVVVALGFGALWLEVALLDWLLDDRAERQTPPTRPLAEGVAGG